MFVFTLQCVIKCKIRAYSYKPVLYICGAEALNYINIKILLSRFVFSLHIPGYYGMLSFKMSTLSVLSDGVLCQDWVRRELPRADLYQKESLSVPQCPCHDSFFWFDRRFQFVPWWTLNTRTYTTYSFGNRYGQVRNGLL